MEFLVAILQKAVREGENCVRFAIMSPIPSQIQRKTSRFLQNVVIVIISVWYTPPNIPDIIWFQWGKNNQKISSPQDGCQTDALLHQRNLGNFFFFIPNDFNFDEHLKVRIQKKISRIHRTFQPIKRMNIIRYATS